MQFKKGLGWRACFDEERELYTAELGGGGDYRLYEITAEHFGRLKEEMPESEVYGIIADCRKLYMAVNDRCGPPYTVVFDEDYEALCPWADVVRSGKEWSAEMTDAAVEALTSEENNRQQRRKKREQRNTSES